MTQKLKETADDGKITQYIMNSAHQIWLAGLGAFAKTQVEGTKLFESLVKEGEAVQARAGKAANAQFAQVSKSASGAWDGDEAFVLDGELVVDRRAARRAEVERGHSAAVAGARVRRGGAGGAHLVALEAGLSAERAAGALLAREAMTHRDPDGLALGDQGELPTAA